jgi:2-polyprenyl-6-methoxyphenol hydroxylase-like FAD-dependent oxidoreductase
MNTRVVIIGGSIAGLGAAIGLARRGCSVTIVERDPPPPDCDGDAAFVEWERRGVPQFRQVHGFTARARNLLLEHAPDVVDRLRADGIEETNVFKMLAPPEAWLPEDELFTGFTTRRPAFELALRRTADVEPGVEFLCPAVATGLRYANDTSGQPPQVVGVTLEGGRELDTDVVLDCGGRRSPVTRWLTGAGVHVPEEIEDTGMVYYTRYFRQHEDSTLPRIALFGVRGMVGRCATLGFAGDHNTFGLMFGPRPDDEPLRALRHTAVWEALARSVPTMAPWVAPENSTPLVDVQPMAGNQNVRRHFVVDGRPLVHGLLPVGDSLCATNPFYGWGASMALTYAFASVHVVANHRADPEAMALAYDDAVRLEADAVYRESAGNDRARNYALTDTPIPDHDRDEIARQDLIAGGIIAGALRDVVLGRAFLRRINLIDRPDGILDDPEVYQRAVETREILSQKPPRPDAMDRDTLLAIVAEARAAAGV